MDAHRLLVETPTSRNLEYVVEEKNLRGDDEKRMWIVGEYMMAGEKNKNGRVYDVGEMAREVNQYNEHHINKLMK